MEELPGIEFVFVINCCLSFDYERQRRENNGFSLETESSVRCIWCGERLERTGLQNTLDKVNYRFRNSSIFPTSIVV